METMSVRQANDLTLLEIMKWISARVARFFSVHDTKARK
jgi:hypothetical protein